jgi:sorting nexin-29
MHAFDSIKRNKTLDSLNQNKIPPKLIRLIKLTLENITAKVKVNNAYTKEFRVESREKQVELLSPTLFSLVIDTILIKLDLRGNISTRLRQLTAYAEDILITACTKQSLIDTFQQLKNNSMKVRIIIN